MIQKAQISWLILSTLLLLLPTSCMHKKAVVFDHDPQTGQDTMTYRGKAISAEELFELGEKADFGKIDLIRKNDGTTQKLDFKAWHTGMRLLPGAMQSMQEGLVE